MEVALFVPPAVRLYKCSFTNIRCPRVFEVGGPLHPGHFLLYYGIIQEWAL